MPKTNHNRNFIDCRNYSVNEINRWSKQGLTARGFDWTNGKRGAARARRGLKKYVKSRKRFADKMNLLKDENR